MAMGWDTSFDGPISGMVSSARRMHLPPVHPLSDWSAWRPASCLPSCFHEADRGGLIRQPSNALSSAAFVVVAVALLLRRQLPRPAVGTRPPLPEARGWQLLFAVSLIVIGLGSAFFHASLTFVGQTADVAGMYLLATFVIAYAGLTTDPALRRRIAAQYLAMNAALLVALLWLPSARRWLFAVLIAIGLFLEYRRVRRDRYDTTALGQSAVVMGIAFGIWLLDQRGWPLSSTHWLQGHALWHLLSAIAALQLWRHYARWPQRAAALRA
jgi:hypothetical protein